MVKHRYAKRWRDWILIAAKCPQFNVLRDLGKVKLTITVTRGRQQDKDNMYASVKPVVDAIKYRGWLVDDSPKWLDLEVREIARRDQGLYKTVIEWDGQVFGETQTE
jgi:hypothetical protein